MKCPNCGRENENGAKFCSKCGRSLEISKSYKKIPETEKAKKKGKRNCWSTSDWGSDHCRNLGNKRKSGKKTVSGSFGIRSKISGRTKL